MVVKDYLDEVLEFGEHLWRALAMKLNMGIVIIMIRKHLTTPFTRRMTSLRSFSSLPQKDSLAIISGETDLVDMLL